MDVPLSTWLDRLKLVKEGLAAFHTNVAKVLGSTAIEEVNIRIVERGEDADGKKLVHAKSGKEYSEAEIPLPNFVDEGIIRPDQARRLPIMVAYVDVKKAIGRYRGKRDLTLTGRMWANTGLTEHRGTQTRFFSTVAGRTTETQDKLDRNSELSDVDVLELSKEEEERLEEDYDTELQIYVEDILDP